MFECSFPIGGTSWEELGGGLVGRRCVIGTGLGDSKESGHSS